MLSKEGCFASLVGRQSHSPAQLLYFCPCCAKLVLSEEEDISLSDTMGHCLVAQSWLCRPTSPFSDHSLRLVAGQKCWIVCSVCVREEHGCAGPELGPIASLMVAPEEGSWRVDEVGTHPLLLILSSHIYMLVQQAFGPLKLSQCCQQSCISALAISCCQHMPL